MSKIIKMPDTLANLIAAGEVVDRPASIVKELVENSIDAKATQITIIVNNLGFDQIIITDNGSGMDKQDLHQAFLTHATSKIMTKADLNTILTMGFRGEAIPSIASVAKVKISSRIKGDDGYFVEYHETTCVSEGLVSMNVGTKVEVNDLFYNTPARFKYLKSENAEKNAIFDLFDKFALGHPGIAFSLIMDGKKIKQTPGNYLNHILLNEIFGKQVASSALFFSCEISKVKVSGYLFSHLVSRSRKKDIHLFINQRAVKNYALTQSIIDGYHTLLMSNRYPIVILQLTIDPSLVDVNVHPQKLEVKLSNELLFSHQLQAKIKEFLTNEIRKEVIVKPEVRKFEKMELELESQPVFSNIQREKNYQLKENYSMINDKTDQEDIVTTVFETKINPEKITHTTYQSYQTLPKPNTLEYLATLGGTYLLFQNQVGLYLLDQHAAAERIKYEYYYEKLGIVNNERIDLLIPQQLSLSTNELIVIRSNLDIYQKLGFRFEEDSLIAHPLWVKLTEVEDALLAISEMIDQGELDLSKYRDDLAKSISCKKSIKANHQLSQLEIDRLINDLSNCKNFLTCPHGRPIMIKLSFYEIEKLFKRVV